MITYQLSSGGVIFRDDSTGDEKNIPNDPSNIDWQKYQEWLSIPNTPISQFTLDELKDIRKKELDIKFNQILDGNISYNSNTYSSSKLDRNIINTIVLVGDRLELTFPINWNDINKSSKSLSLDDFKKIQKGHGLLAKDCVDNYLTLFSNIDISSDPESVDIDSGWPALPYVVI